MSEAIPDKMARRTMSGFATLNSTYILRPLVDLAAAGVSAGHFEEETRVGLYVKCDLTPFIKGDAQAQALK